MSEPSDGKCGMKSGDTLKAIVRKILLGLYNRDGEIMIAEADDGTCYLVAEAETFHNAETLQGLGSTEEIEISRDAFDALANATCERPEKAGKETTE